VESSPIRHLLRNSGFLRLLATRLTGSFGDGLLQAALATFVLFSPERQPTPLAIAVSFGILLLPYSLVGPFAGVFLDRWRRRQVLVRANWLRALTVLGIAAVVMAEHDGLDLGLIVLATLGIGRFVLSGLSASLPHVVPRDELVTANSFAPTAGTVVFGIGALAGIMLRSLLGGGDQGVRYVLVAAAITYLLAGLVPLGLGKDRLGPSGDRPGETVADVARGLVEGFRVLAQDKPSWESVVANLVHRVAFGALTVLLLLMLRNTVNPTSRPEAALRDFSFIAAAVTIGALLAALLTPTMTRRIGTVNWTCVTLLAAAVTAPLALVPVNVWAMTAGGAVVGLSQQCAKIGADTTLQRRITDDHLGRVFSLFDVGVNVSLVIGALIVAVGAPLSGVTLPGFFGLSLLYAATAVWYRRTIHDTSDTAAPATGTPG
jgi:MFS family permease